MKQTEAPKCPRCGGESRLMASRSDSHWVACLTDGCKIESLGHPTPEEAIEWWSKPFNRPAAELTERALAHFGTYEGDCPIDYRSAAEFTAIEIARNNKAIAGRLRDLHAGNHLIRNCDLCRYIDGELQAVEEFESGSGGEEKQ